MISNVLKKVFDMINSRFNHNHITMYQMKPFNYSQHERSSLTSICKESHYISSTNTGVIYKRIDNSMIAQNWIANPVSIHGVGFEIMEYLNR